MKKEDPRVRRTKKLLRQSLIGLMRIKTIGEITVKEISELADINRGTFYKYYKDVPDMVQQIENNLAIEFKAIINKPNNNLLETFPRPMLIEIYCFLRNNKDICEVLLGPYGNKEFIKRMKDIAKDNFLKNYISIISKKKPRYFEYFSSFVGEGTISLFGTWLVEGMIESPEEMADITIHFMLHAYKVLL